MTLNIDDLSYDEDQLNGCCGITLLTDLDVYKQEKTLKLNLKEWKEHWDSILVDNRVGMLMATTSNQQKNVEIIFKRTKWKKARTCTNPKTRNTITVWTYL
jgi:ferritin-like metal-binding protein YciE